MIYARLLFWLLVGHALADYPLQATYLSAAKRRNSGKSTPWWIALSMHALIHAGAVALVTGSLWLGGAEFLLHWIIDLVKCEKKIGDTTDQVLHVACKIAWAAIAVAGL